MRKRASSKRESIYVKTIQSRQILFKSKETLGTFNQIVLLKEQGMEYNKALEEYAFIPLGDGLVKLAYFGESTHFDVIFQYELGLDQEKSSLRRKFEFALLSQGLLLEREQDTEYTGFCFLKVLVPFQKLLDEAEKTKLRLKVTASDKFLDLKKAILLARSRSSGSVCADWWISDDTKAEIEAISARFSRSKQESFIGKTRSDYLQAMKDLFRNAQKNLLAYNIIQRVKVLGPMDKFINIQTLIHDKVYMQYYALHDGSPFDKSNLRGQIYSEWNHWFAKQPIHKIRAYFGEKVAFCHGWQDHYLYWLSLAGLVGGIVLFYGLLKCIMAFIQGKAENINIVYYSLFDNELTVPFSFFMSLWGVLYVQFWSRRQLYLAAQWNTIDYLDDELPRPTWKPTTVKRNTITGAFEPHFPFKSRLYLKTISFIILFALFIVAIGNILLYIVYNNFFSRVLQSSSPHYKIWNAIISGSLSLITIFAISYLCQYVSKKLTDSENHKTDTDYQNALIGKYLVFDFVNFYGSLIYIGVVKIWIGQDQSILGSIQSNAKGDFCEENNCMMELTIQMAIIFLARSIIYHLMNLFEPLFTKLKEIYDCKFLYDPICMSLNKNECIDGGLNKLIQTLKRLDVLRKCNLQSLQMNTNTPQHVADLVLAETNIQNLDIDGYRYSTVQFGFVVFFSASFPLAPLFATIHNLIQKKIDANNLCTRYQRPFALRANGIGVWYDWIFYISYLGVALNAFILSFTSSYFHNSYLLRYENVAGKWVVRLAFMLVFEHAVLFVQFLVTNCLPSISSKAFDAIKRKEWIESVISQKESTHIPTSNPIITIQTQQ